MSFFFSFLPLSQSLWVGYAYPKNSTWHNRPSNHLRTQTKSSHIKSNYIPPPIAIRVFLFFLHSTFPNLFFRLNFQKASCTPKIYLFTSIWKRLCEGAWFVPWRQNDVSSASFFCAHLSLNVHGAQGFQAQKKKKNYYSDKEFGWTGCPKSVRTLLMCAVFVQVG